MTTASAAMTATFITPTATSTIIRPHRVADVLDGDAVVASWVQSLRMFSATRADQRALHDWLNPAASRAAMDGSLAADCSASTSRRYAAAPCRAARSRAASSLLANAT